MKKISAFLLFLLAFISSTLVAQEEKSSKMGQTTIEELQMRFYDKDSTAGAVVLYEHANIYLDTENDNNTRTDFYYRIKILDPSAFDLASVTINLYKKKKIKDLEAITYNLSEDRIIKNHLLENDIFTTKESTNWTTKKFTLSNIKVGSVIEYKYSILSPYSGIEDWSFQSDIPKIKSEFNAAILANYKYNVRIIGLLKLNKNNFSIKKRCVYLDGLGFGSCLVYSYGINDVPAFKEEDYMLAKKNYISRLSFDLKSFTDTKGYVEKYTTTWEEADKKLKSNFFNNQTSKKNYFKKRIPDSILATKNSLKKAQKIYTFIQNHYTWNKKYWTNDDIKVKEAFDDKLGDVGEINLSLFNSLNAANIDANLVVLSTRNNGVPTKLYPIIYDYNYVIVNIKIGETDYFLDATEKMLPFAALPIRTLNGEARIINFKEKGSWVTLKPQQSSIKNIRTKLSLNKDGELNGFLNIRYTGYYAYNQREKLATLTEENYLDDFESKNPDLVVKTYNIKEEKNIYKPLDETFNIQINKAESLGSKIRINPFLFDRTKENPFKLKERFYPVNFGAPKKINYSLSLQIPENYTISQLPKNKAFALPNNGGLFILKAEYKNNELTIFTRFKIHKKAYSSDEYFALKEFFNQIIIAENSYIIIENKK
jgi:hypothetical protein